MRLEDLQIGHRYLVKHEKKLHFAVLMGIPNATFHPRSVFMFLETLGLAYAMISTRDIIEYAPRRRRPRG